jgi:AbiV family abortive infection protein
MFLENAEQYYKDAELLFSFKSYGHAFALVVLCEEEFGKAVLYHLYSQDLLPESFTSCLRQNLYQPLEKRLMAIGYAIGSNIDELMECIEESSRFVRTGTKKSPLTNRNLKLKEKMLNDLEEFQGLLEKKERGFYVRFNVKERVSSPNSIGKSEVKKYLHQVKDKLELLKPFFLLSLTPSQKSVVKACIGEF